MRHQTPAPRQAEAVANKRPNFIRRQFFKLCAVLLLCWFVFEMVSVFIPAADEYQLLPSTDKATRFRQQILSDEQLLEMEQTLKDFLSRLPTDDPYSGDPATGMPWPGQTNKNIRSRPNETPHEKSFAQQK